MKEFKKTFRRTVSLTMKEEDEWLTKASKLLKNGLAGLGVENRQAAVRGTIHMENWKARDITRKIL